MDPDLILTIVRVTVGSLFLSAALLKLRQARLFVVVTVDFQILPVVTARTLGWVLPYVEAVVGLALIVGVLSRPFSLLAILLVLAFSAAILVNLRRGRVLNCGCFGGSGRIGSSTLARNLVIATGAIAVAGAGDGPLSADNLLRTNEVVPSIVAVFSLMAVAILLGRLAPILKGRIRFLHLANSQN